MSITLRKFDLSRIANGNCVIFGENGRFSLILEYLYHNRNIPNILAFLQTDEYKPHLPETTIYREYSHKLVKRFIGKQKKSDNRGLLILDRWIMDNSIEWIFMNGFSINITMIVMLPYNVAIPPHIRFSINYVFILRESIRTVLKFDRERLYDNYAGCMIHNYYDFLLILEATTDKCGCLVITNTSMNKLEDTVFWYKSEKNLI